MTFNGHATYYVDDPDSIKARIINRHIPIETIPVGAEYVDHISFFGSTNNGFTITWGNGNIEILYGKDTKPGEAVKQFFDWLKDFIKGKYYIIRKKDLDKILKEIK